MFLKEIKTTEEKTLNVKIHICFLESRTDVKECMGAVSHMYLTICNSICAIILSFSRPFHGDL